jgi:O-antigen/teichoic acid export membrane protein
LRIVTHDFGPVRWGEVVAASALANLFVGLCDFGLTRIVSREMATPGANQRAVYGGGLLAGLIVSSVAMALMTAAVFAVYADRPQLRALSLVLVVSLPPNAIWVISGAALISRARNDARGVIDVTSSLFLLGAAGATVAAALGLAGYLWLTVATDVATAVLGLGIAHHYVRADFRSGRRRVRELIHRATPLGISQAVTSVAYQVDVVLLSLLAPLAAVGTFGVALQLTVFGTAIPPMLTAAILPKFVDASPERQQLLAQRAFDVLASGGAALPLASGVEPHRSFC